MKTMKILAKSALLSIAILIGGCGQGVENKPVVLNEGEVQVENGRGVLDTIPFDCIGCVENLTYDQFLLALKESTRMTKDNLNNPLSFIPQSMRMIVVQEDSLYTFDTNTKIDSVITVITDYKYIGQNAYGTELGGDHTVSFTLVSGKIKNISEDIKIKDLEFDSSGYINRSLYGYNEDDFIRVTPTKSKILIVQSSLNCVDEGATFMVTLQNDEEINIRSWNDFNCDGTAYYHFFSRGDRDKLSKIGIKYLYIYSRGKSAMVRVPKNNSDYFQQLMKIY